MTDLLEASSIFAGLMKELSQLRIEVTQLRQRLQGYQSLVGFPTGAICPWCGEPVLDRSPDRAAEIRQALNESPDRPWAHDHCARWDQEKKEAVHAGA